MMQVVESPRRPEQSGLDFAENPLWSGFVRFAGEKKIPGSKSIGAGQVRARQSLALPSYGSLTLGQTSLERILTETIPASSGCFHVFPDIST